TQLYHHSTHTPLMVRWPGVTSAGTVDEDHFVSAIDFLPTLLEIMQATHPTPDRLHGRSFAPVLRGQTQPERTHVIKQYNENSGRWRHPMRGIQSRRWLYLYNPWSDGRRQFATATTGTASYRRMRALAPDDPQIASRLDLFDHRVVEELYDVQSDPDCLVNRIDDADAKAALNQWRRRLADELSRVGDPVAPLLQRVDDVGLRDRYMEAEDQRSEAHRKKRNAAKKKKSA
ncbi:MAG: sulfatase/phosphatase domain-containing protein, partial [Planctomycetota bacterium]